MPVGATVGVHVVAEALDIDGSVVWTAGRALAGTALGVGVLALGAASGSWEGALAGAAVALVAPSAFAAAGMGRASLRPASLSTATGAYAPGLRVTVGL